MSTEMKPRFKEGQKLLCIRFGKDNNFSQISKCEITAIYIKGYEGNSIMYEAWSDSGNSFQVFESQLFTTKEAKKIISKFIKEYEKTIPEILKS